MKDILPELFDYRGGSWNSIGSPKKTAQIISLAKAEIVKNDFLNHLSVDGTKKKESKRIFSFIKNLKI